MPETAVVFIGQLAVGLCRAHTEPTLVVALAKAFAAVSSLCWVELTFLDRHGSERAVRADASSDAATFPALGSERQAGLQLVARVVKLRADATAPELRRAHREGARALAIMPLHACSVDRQPAGRLVVAVRDAMPSELASADALTAIADVVSAALTSCRALAKVGEVSRRAHVETRELRGELERERVDRLDEHAIVARCPAMRRLLDHVLPQVAAHDITVLVLGESGVGKELVARRIHRLSRRGQRAMLSVNCGALPETLIDSTLFGHERGAFTGAAARQPGIFERAHRGTLFLDEVGELTPSTQTRLLRVLERHEVERVGGSQTVPVDVRVIAATNRDLSALVAQGKFRLDLFHRLAIVPITVPPLRERIEDIELLVPVLLDRIARRAGLTVILPNAAQIRALRARPWPGNVRELENVLARALLLADRGKLAVDAALADSGSTPGPVMTFTEGSRRCIEAALASSGGRIHGQGGAAMLLKLKPTTLQSKMRKLGFPRPTRG